MKNWWHKWTYEVPLAIGDALWDVLVVQLAALLDRLTVRRVVALIPIVVLALAYHHQIPIPPELMLVGDLLAYIDIFSVLLLLGILSRVATVLFVMKQATARAAALTRRLVATVQRLDLRRQREGGAGDPRRSGGQAKADDEDPLAIDGVAWA